MDKKILLPEDLETCSSTDNVFPGTSEDLPQPYDDIANNIYTLESNCRFLKQASKAIGTTKDNMKLRNNTQSVLFVTKTIIDQIKSDVYRIIYESRKKDMQCKLQIEKLKSRFQDSVEAYSNLQMELFLKLKRNLPSEPCPITQGEHKRVDYAYEDPDELSTQQTFQKSLEEKQFEIIEREDAIRKIESDMLDVNDIMRDLGTLLHAQGDTIILIENVIEDTHGTVEAGGQEIEKATEYLNKRKKRILYLVILLLISLAVVGVIVFFILHRS